MSAVRMRSLFVSTPIFYANAAPHLGHLYSAVVADAVQRFERLLGPGCDVVFSTGTDEHGTKVLRAAAERGASPRDYCDDVSDRYRTLFRDAGVDFTDFVRTTEKRHETAVHRFWTELKNNGHVYLSQYRGWYSVNDECFVPESQVSEQVRDGEKITVCSESGHPVEHTQEENYMFKLSAFKSDLAYWLKGDVVTPRKYLDILRSYLTDHYLPDISISRPSKRVPWAIKVPDDPDHSIYVWMDALINYLTVVGYPFDNNPNPHTTNKWPADLHVIGKDILKFHGIYWPAFLLAAGLSPPRKLLCHAHWTVDGRKMSKSYKNFINPYNTVSSLEALRYFLLREGTMHSDANYSEIKMVRILNSELADTIGNLLNRCTSIQLNPKQEFPCLHFDEFNVIKQCNSGSKLISLVNGLSENCKEHYLNFNFYKVVDCVIATLHAANEFFNDLKPWNLKKKAEKHKELDVILHMTLETLRITSIILFPIIPNMTTKLLDKLLIPKDSRMWQDSEIISWQNNISTNTKSISPDYLLFFEKIPYKQEKMEQMK